jgi:hypothetical protein
MMTMIFKLLKQIFCNNPKNIVETKPVTDTTKMFHKTDQQIFVDKIWQQASKAISDSIDVYSISQNETVDLLDEYLKKYNYHVDRRNRQELLVAILQHKLFDTESWTWAPPIILMNPDGVTKMGLKQYTPQITRQASLIKFFEQGEKK